VLSVFDAIHDCRESFTAVYEEITIQGLNPFLFSEANLIVECDFIVQRFIQFTAIKMEI